MQKCSLVIIGSDLSKYSTSIIFTQQSIILMEGAQDEKKPEGKYFELLM